MTTHHDLVYRHHGMTCPRGCDAPRLAVESLSWCALTPCGLGSPQQPVTWDAMSRCRCECGWYGTVEDALGRVAACAACQRERPIAGMLCRDGALVCARCALEAAA